MTEPTNPELTMLVWNSGAYYTSVAQDKPIVPNELELIAESPIEVTMGRKPMSPIILLRELSKRLDDEAIKYARSRQHTGFVTLDDYRKPEEKSFQLSSDLFSYMASGNALLLRRK